MFPVQPPVAHLTKSLSTSADSTEEMSRAIKQSTQFRGIRTLDQTRSRHRANALHLVGSDRPFNLIYSFISASVFFLLHVLLHGGRMCGIGQVYHVFIFMLTGSIVLIGLKQGIHR
ncbi:hypothetical protein HYQ46_001092 [Verticillium longisporum]|nr:hypothetical protein HYQ44_019556 [Verticillium longisporum]KAG7149989.1 hypothetical protein HYQ46_001092 [Verticillium longisporum]